MSIERLNKDNQITSWLDCVGTSDVDEFITLFNSCLPYRSDKNRYDILYNEDNNSPKFEIRFYHSNNEKPYIMFLGEFGPVNNFGECGIATSSRALGIYKDWYAIVRRANEGILINGKNYDEAIREFYQEQNRKFYAPKIEELAREMQKLRQQQEVADNVLDAMIREYQSSDEMGD